MKCCPDGKASCSFPTKIFLQHLRILIPKRNSLWCLRPWSCHETCTGWFCGSFLLFPARERQSLVWFSELSQDKTQLFSPNPLIFLEDFIYHLFCCSHLLCCSPELQGTTVWFRVVYTHLWRSRTVFADTFCSSNQQAHVVVPPRVSQMCRMWEADVWMSWYNQGSSGQKFTVSLMAWDRSWCLLEVGAESLCSLLAAGRREISQE